MKATYSHVEIEGLNFLIAELNGKLAACTVPDRSIPNTEKFLEQLQSLYSEDLEISEGKANEEYIEAIMDVFQGKPHALSYDDIAFESMKKSYAQVLKTLFSIKKGQTITYSDLAMKSGLTKRHSRFVGSIMAKNPIPLIVPCHRVVKKSGELGNYSGSGGTATKKRLLTLEAR